MEASSYDCLTRKGRQYGTGTRP